MQRYSNLDRDSGVVAYESGFDFIRVQFSDGAVYLYTYTSAGSNHIDRMKTLATRGDGLNAYIIAHVSEAYERKEK